MDLYLTRFVCSNFAENKQALTYQFFIRSISTIELTVWQPSKMEMGL
jgi:hypothetical protein